MTTNTLREAAEALDRANSEFMAGGLLPAAKVLGDAWVDLRAALAAATPTQTKPTRERPWRATDDDLARLECICDSRDGWHTSKCRDPARIPLSLSSRGIE